MRLFRLLLCSIVATFSIAAAADNYLSDRDWLQELRPCGVEVQPTGNFEGFYLGGNVGLANGVFRHQFVVFESRPVVVPVSNYTSISTATIPYTGTAGVDFGYAFIPTKDFYLGLQLEANFVGIKDNAYLSQFPLNGAIGVGLKSQVTPELHSVFGLALRPGWIVSPNTLLFLHVGAVVSDLTYRLLFASNIGQISTLPLQGKAD